MIVQLFFAAHYFYWEFLDKNTSRDNDWEIVGFFIFDKYLCMSCEAYVLEILDICF